LILASVFKDVNAISKLYSFSCTKIVRIEEYINPKNSRQIASLSLGTKKPRLLQLHIISCLLFILGKGQNVDITYILYITCTSKRM